MSKFLSPDRLLSFSVERRNLGNGTKQGKLRLVPKSPIRRHARHADEAAPIVGHNGVDGSSAQPRSSCGPRSTSLAVPDSLAPVVRRGTISRPCSVV